MLMFLQHVHVVLRSMLCSVLCALLGCALLGWRPRQTGQLAAARRLIRSSTRAGGESMHSPACARPVPGRLGRGYCAARLRRSESHDACACFSAEGAALCLPPAGV